MENKIVNEKIENIDVSDIENIILDINNYKKVKLKTDNFYKIVKLIISKYNKTEFKAWELKEAYDYIINNYESSLDAKTFEKIKVVLQLFVNHWWKVIISYIWKEDIINDVIEEEIKINWAKIVFSYIILIIVCSTLTLQTLFIESIDKSIFYNQNYFMLMTVIYLFIFIVLCKKLLKLSIKRSFYIFLLNILITWWLFWVLCWWIVLFNL